MTSPKELATNSASHLKYRLYFDTPNASCTEKDCSRAYPA
jgi:hypothetical protein